MPNATVRVNARALPDAPPRLTIEQVIAMTDAELVAVIVASANPKSLWPQMVIAATELERRAAAEAFHASACR
jgi:hypothetical protein